MTDSKQQHTKVWWAGVCGNAVRYHQDEEKAALASLENARKGLFKERMRFSVVMSMDAGATMSEAQMEKAIRKRMKREHEQLHHLSMHFTKDCPLCVKEASTSEASHD